MCAVTYSYVFHDSFLCFPWLVHTCDKYKRITWGTRIACFKSKSRVSKEPYRPRVKIADNTDAFTYTHMIGGALCTHRCLCVCHIYKYHESWTISVVLETCWCVCVCFPSAVPCIIFKCAITYFYVCHDSFLRAPWCSMTHFYVYHD